MAQRINPNQAHVYQAVSHSPSKKLGTIVEAGSIMAGFVAALAVGSNALKAYRTGKADDIQYAKSQWIGLTAVVIASAMLYNFYRNRNKTPVAQVTTEHMKHPARRDNNVNQETGKSDRPSNTQEQTPIRQNPLQTEKSVHLQSNNNKAKTHLQTLTQNKTSNAHFVDGDESDQETDSSGEKSKNKPNNATSALSQPGSQQTQHSPQNDQPINANNGRERERELILMTAERENESDDEKAEASSVSLQRQRTAPSISPRAPNTSTMNRSKTFTKNAQHSSRPTNETNPPSFPNDVTLNSSLTASTTSPVETNPLALDMFGDFFLAPNLDTAAASSAPAPMMASAPESIAVSVLANDSVANNAGKDTQS